MQPNGGGKSWGIFVLVPWERGRAELVRLDRRGSTFWVHWARLGQFFRALLHSAHTQRAYLPGCTIPPPRWLGACKNAQVLNRACLAVRDALQQITPLRSAFHAFLVCPKNWCVLVQTFKPFLVGQNMASLAVKYLFFTTLSYSYQKFGAGKVGIFCLGACEAARIQQARLAWIVQPGLLSALNQAWPAI